MKLERLILIAFFGNYLINNLVGAIVSIIPASGATSTYTDPHYYAYIVLASALVVVLVRWYMMPSMFADGVKNGMYFGVGGFIVAVLTAFVSGVSGVILQSGSLSAAMNVLPNFGPYLLNLSTLVLFFYWVLPSVVWGWYVARNAPKSMPAPAPVTGRVM